MTNLKNFSKSNVRFKFQETQDELAKSYCLTGDSSSKTAPNQNFLFSTYYEDIEICRCSYEQLETSIVPSILIHSDYQNESFILASIIKILILESEQTGRFQKLTVLSKNNRLVGELKKHNFTFDGCAYYKILDPIKGKLISDTKKIILEKIKISEKYGRGFVLHTSDINPLGLQHLSQEYNEIAWGLTSWAKNSEIDDDEKNIINIYATHKNVIEIGAGSGRLSELIINLSASTTLTDYTKESYLVLKEKFVHTSVLQDDMVHTKLTPNSYDAVLFLENGLGNLLSRENRRTAVENMCKLITKNGVLILGLRTLKQSPCEHVMIASQNEHIIGIYHTFSHDEILSMLPPGYKISKQIEGNPRPAGGNAFFVIIERSL